jgi:DNA-directed RNA polymerase subunit RPC12/RpoP
MPYPIKTCISCGEEFELKPGKPGFANRCPSCSEEDSADPKSTDPKSKRTTDADQRKVDREANEARRQAMRNLLYRKDS